MANQGTLFSGEVTLYFHDGGDRYYCRFKDRSGKSAYIKKSLRTRDYTEAVARAKDLYLKHVALVDAGFDPRDMTWDQAVDACVRKMDDGQPKDYLIQMNKAYFSKFFTRYESVRDIKSEGIMDYFRWRVDFWEKKGITPHSYPNKAPVASPATMRKERGFIRLVFSGLFNQRKINRMPEMPSMDRLRRLAQSKGRFDVETQRRRPSFSPADYAKIQRHLFVKQAKTDNWEASVQRLGVIRLRLWCEIIRRTGIRPQELRLIRFADVRHEICEPEPDENGKMPNGSGFVISKIRISAAVAKTGKARFTSDIKIGGLKKELQDWKDINEAVFGYRLKSSDLIFPKKRVRTDPDSKWNEPFDFGWAFQRMLRECNLYEVEDEDGNIVTRSSYSLRAMFIERRIKEGVPVRFIAEACGTSQQMIDRYYDGSNGINFFDHLRKRQWKTLS